MVEINVRPMNENDIGQAANIHRNVVREGLGQVPDYVIEDFFKSSIKKSPKTCLVAVIDDNVAGFIIGGIKEWGFGVEHSGWIEMIEVDPKQMGKGIGKTLVDALINYFKKEEIEEVYTSVQWDSGDLISFFKSVGFDKSSFINLKYKLK